MTPETVVQVLWTVSAVGLIILVLLHSPKGDGLGGLSGQAQLFTSTKSAEQTLNRVTWILTILFIGLTIVLSAKWLAVTPNLPTALPSPAISPAPVTPPSPALPPG
jgi:preprotein translocase subunit SecG